MGLSQSEPLIYGYPFIHTGAHPPPWEEHSLVSVPGGMVCVVSISQPLKHNCGRIFFLEWNYSLLLLFPPLPSFLSLNFLDLFQNGESFIASFHVPETAPRTSQEDGCRLVSKATCEFWEGERRSPILGITLPCCDSSCAILGCGDIMQSSPHLL